jgi:diadenosine tetraphosphate (Ap4A) HIT family hydrolase
MSGHACRACQENQDADRGGDPWAIALLATGYVRLSPTQYYRGATFFVSRICVAELQELPAATRSTHLDEMALVAHAVFEAVRPRKMNYEALGNSVPHLHWRLTPRPHDDPRPSGPIWEDPDFLRALQSGSARPSDDERDALRRTLLDELQRSGVTIERTFC